MNDSIIAMRQEIDAMRRDLNRIPSVNADNPGFWALLTAADLVIDNRWKYSWAEIQWTMTAGVLGYTQALDARVGPVTITGIGSTGYAWNSTEMDNHAFASGSGWSDDTLSITDSNGDMSSLRIEAIQQIGMTQSSPPWTKYPIVFLRQLKLQGSNELAYCFSGWNTPQIYSAGS